jgi:hypothetical protein
MMYGRNKGAAVTMRLFDEWVLQWWAFRTCDWSRGRWPLMWTVNIGRRVKALLAILSRADFAHLLCQAGLLYAPRRWDGVTAESYQENE